MQYNYDASGNRSQVIYPSGRTLDYTYDGINRLMDIEQNSVSLAHFDYDLLNRRTLKSFPSTPSLESAYSYYFDNRLEELVNRINGGGVISQNQYTYDNVGNRLSHMSLAQSFTYGYNDIYELTSVSGSEAHSYLYDNVGNRTTADSVNYVANSLNQYTSVAAQAITYDTNGNLTDDGTNTYAYDEENRLLTADNINHSASYTYDPFNRRVSKTVDGVTTYYVYDGDEVIAEYEGGSLTAEYTYADSIDEVLTMDRNGNTYYYHYDGLGSMTEVTDAAGAVQESYKYDPYGNPSIFDSLGSPLTTSAIGNRYMYTGREWDEESSIYYYRARMYDPVLGRFLQRDPLGYVDGMNLYSFVGNNAPNWRDPLGLKIELQWHEVLGGHYHSFLRITPDNQSKYVNNKNFVRGPDNKLFTTIGAGPGLGMFAILGYLYLGQNWGPLVAGFKRGTEKNPHQSGIEINYCLVDYKNEDEFIDRLIELAEYYMDNLQYEINPSWGGGYNSNSFIHGLLNAAHGKYSRPPVNVTGWEQPVPSEAFGVE